MGHSVIEVLDLPASPDRPATTNGSVITPRPEVTVERNLESFAVKVENANTTVTVVTENPLVSSRGVAQGVAYEPTVMAPFPSQPTGPHTTRRNGAAPLPPPIEATSRMTVEERFTTLYPALADRPIIVVDIAKKVLSKGLPAKELDLDREIHVAMNAIIRPIAAKPSPMENEKDLLQLLVETSVAAELKERYEAFKDEKFEGLVSTLASSIYERWWKTEPRTFDGSDNGRPLRIPEKFVNDVMSEAMEILRRRDQKTAIEIEIRDRFPQTSSRQELSDFVNNLVQNAYKAWSNAPHRNAHSNPYERMGLPPEGYYLDVIITQVYALLRKHSKEELLQSLVEDDQGPRRSRRRSH
jgi:hypothetical protein